MSRFNTATVNPTAGGSVTGTGTFIEGSDVTLTASVNTGYIVDSWVINGTTYTTTNNTYTIQNITSDVQVQLVLKSDVVTEIGIYGDLDGNGEVEIEDVIIILKSILQLITLDDVQLLLGSFDHTEHLSERAVLRQTEHQLSVAHFIFLKDR